MPHLRRVYAIPLAVWRRCGLFFYYGIGNYFLFTKSCGVFRSACCSKKSWAGKLRIFAVGRKVLGLPKPYPPLEPPFPPSSTRYLIGGVQGVGGFGGKGGGGGVRLDL
jgi:hypothetical protein